MKNYRENFAWPGAVCVLCLLLCGCASGGKSPGAAGGSPDATLAKATGKSARGATLSERSPFPYQPLKVRNACFVESVHFYDQYLALRRGETEGWVRVLQWGDNDSRSRQIGLGHAVSVCRVGGLLWMYDVNHGFQPLRAGVEQRGDSSAVGAEIFVRYPQFKPVYVSYEGDSQLDAPSVVPEYLFNNASLDVREATKVASELGRFRIARVIDFQLKDRRSLTTKESAAAVFSFGRRLCVYFPARGTYLVSLREGAPGDLPGLAKIVRQVFPDACGVRWHDGPVWYLPKGAGVTANTQSQPRAVMAAHTRADANILVE